MAKNRFTSTTSYKILQDSCHVFSGEACNSTVRRRLLTDISSLLSSLLPVASAHPLEEQTLSGELGEEPQSAFRWPLSHAVLPLRRDFPFNFPFEAAYN